MGHYVNIQALGIQGKEHYGESSHVIIIKLLFMSADDMYTHYNYNIILFVALN